MGTVKLKASKVCMRLVALALPVFISLVACAPFSSTLDAGLLSGKPCKAPCWNNLTPGKSTVRDVETFINTLNARSWPVQRTFPESPSCKLLQIRDKPGLEVGAAVTFTIQAGVLTSVESSSSSLLTLQDLVDHIGPPEYFEALLAIGPDGRFYQVQVYYPSQGLAFGVVTDESDVGVIRPNMLVAPIRYFPPGDLLSYFTVRNSCFMNQDDAIARAQQEVTTDVQPWSGFGKVRVVQTR